MGNRKNILQVVTLLMLTLLMSACTSSVERLDEEANYQYHNEKYRSIELQISPDATDDPDDLVRFNEEELKKVIEKRLKVHKVLDPASQNIINIEINDIRFRSEFNAFMWGAMAGNDQLRGDVQLIEENGRPIHTFHISTTYALGGFMGAQGTREDWLYEAFSKLMLEEILGEND